MIETILQWFTYITFALFVFGLLRRGIEFAWTYAYRWIVPAKIYVFAINGSQEMERRIRDHNISTNVVTIQEIRELPHPVDICVMQYDGDQSIDDDTFNTILNRSKCIHVFAIQDMSVARKKKLMNHPRAFLSQFTGRSLQDISFSIRAPRI